ncbi:MAG: peptidylprolyl isomerase, partial [Stackebrandtia sp.]
ETPSEPPASETASEETPRKQARKEAKRRPLNLEDPDPAWLSRGNGKRTLLGIGLVIVMVAGIGTLGWVLFRPAAAEPAHDGNTAGDKCQITKSEDEGGAVRPPDSLGKTAPRTTATVTTNVGDVTVLLFGDVSPCGVSNFEYLARQAFYKENTCYRLTTLPSDPTVTLRCGDPSGTGKGGPGYRVQAEGAFTGEVGRDYVALINDRKGMAGSSFAFIRGESKPTASLSVIGSVIAGQEVLDQIGGSAGVEPYDDVPPQPVLIKKITITEGAATLPPTGGSSSGTPSGEPSDSSAEPSGTAETSKPEESSDGGIEFPR